MRKFKVGDRVRCAKLGNAEGIVFSTIAPTYYPIVVGYANGMIGHYDVEGKRTRTDELPSIVHIDDVKYDLKHL